MASGVLDCGDLTEKPMGGGFRDGVTEEGGREGFRWRVSIRPYRRAGGGSVSGLPVCVSECGWVRVRQ